MATVGLWLIVLSPFLVMAPFYRKLVALWREKSWLRGRVYMHRRLAQMWSITFVMDIALASLTLVFYVFFDAYWWATLSNLAVVAALAYWSWWQRGRQLAKMRAAEDEELKRVHIPDHPEDL